MTIHQKIRQYLQVPSSLEWLYLVGALLFAPFYLWVMDDAYVYYRYVDNFVLFDLGPVYSKGEYVEGFSSPFWFLFLSLTRALGFGYWAINKLVCGLSIMGAWGLLVGINRGFLRALDLKGPSFNLPMLLVFSSYGFLTYFSSGLESPLVILSALVLAALVVYPNNRTLQVLAGLSPLVRPELIVVAGVVFIYLWRHTSRVPWSMLTVGFLGCVSWQVFRIHYYAELFPNTFYFKSITWWAQGLNYLWDAVEPYNLHIILALVAIGIWQGKESLHTRGMRLWLVLAAVPITLFVIKVGGDARHFRYLLPTLTLVICATAGSVELMLQRYGVGRPVGLMLGAVLLVQGYFNYPNQIPAHPIVAKETSGASLKIAEAHYHRLRKDWTPEILDKNLKYDSLHERQQLAVDHKLAPLVTKICAEAFRRVNRPVIHAYALTEPFMARMPFPLHRPAHIKGQEGFVALLEKARHRFGYKKGALAAVALDDPEWFNWYVENQEKIELIEDRIYNRHDFWENLKLALNPIWVLPLNRVDRG